MLRIAPEEPGDYEAIRAVIGMAFENHPHGGGQEALIVERLREAGALTLALSARAGNVLVGHIAFSSVSIDGQNVGWHGLGPLAVHPQHQKRGIGAALVRAGLQGLAGRMAQGCVVVGEPGYYRRFGFRPEPSLLLEGLPPEYFLALRLGPTLPRGKVSYHPAFSER